jgi:hypothetical protein
MEALLNSDENGEIWGSESPLCSYICLREMIHITRLVIRKRLGSEALKLGGCLKPKSEERERREEAKILCVKVRCNCSSGGV